MVTPDEHAARLRMVSNAAGMLAHPKAHLIFDANPKAREACLGIINAIYGSTPLTVEDINEYAKNSRITVTRSEDGEWKFCYEGDVDHAWLDTPVPMVHKGEPQNG